MKKLSAIFIACFIGRGFAADAPYVQHAAFGWQTLNQSTGYAAEVASRINNLANTNAAAFARAMRALSHNNSALLIASATRHIDGAFADMPAAFSPAWRCRNSYGACAASPVRALEISARYLGGSARFDSDLNGGFNADFGGFAIGANMRGSDGAFEFSLRRSNMEVFSDDISNAAWANGATVAYKFRRGIFFLNTGATAGWIDWRENKDVAGARVDSEIRSQFFASELATGIVLGIFAPRVGIRYSGIMVDKYGDSAMQIFGAWNAGALMLITGVDVRKKLKLADFYLIPSLRLSYFQDMFHAGDAEFGVNIGRSGAYQIPIEWPDRTGFDVGVGLWIASNANVGFGIDYRYEQRSDYTAELARIGISAEF